MSSSVKPPIAISVGDVAGIGPELSLRCAVMEEVTERCSPILYGPKPAIERIAAHLQAELGWNLPLPAIRDRGTLDVERLQPGVFSAQTGGASFEAFEQAIDDALAGKVAAVVTGPIQKEAWHMAGIEFPGHTEVLADRTGVEDFCMMLTSDQISCVLATVHLPLADVPRMLTESLVLRAIRLGAAALKKRHGREPRVTVLGLNPHAGENGLISHGEEASIIEPAMAAARREGISLRGPLPPDTAFTPAMREQTDVYVCMYHDQGLIPLKALSFDDAVNVTLGLPIVRTSVDHGTALDLAWHGRANPSSMLAAIHMAIDLTHG